MAYCESRGGPDGRLQLVLVAWVQHSLRQWEIRKASTMRCEDETVDWVESESE